MNWQLGVILLFIFSAMSPYLYGLWKLIGWIDARIWRSALAIIVAIIVLHGAYLELMGHGYAGVMPESMLRFR